MAGLMQAERGRGSEEKEMPNLDAFGDQYACHQPLGHVSGDDAWESWQGGVSPAREEAVAVVERREMLPRAA